MDPRTARRVGLVAIALGVAGDILFDGQALGINVPIAVGLALAAATLLRAPGARIDRLDLWLPPVALLAAAGVALRTDPPIVALDLALAGAATLAWMIAASGTPLTRRSVDLVAGLGIWAGIALGVGGVTVTTRATADGTFGGASGAPQRVVPIVRGLVLAVPVVVVLAALLASADQAFDVLIGRLIEVPIDVWDLGVRTIVVGAIAWLAAGALSVATGELLFRPERSLLDGEAEARSLGAAATTPPRTRPGWIALPGATEALVVLVAVDVLFGTFVLVQLGYLFGTVGTVLGAGVTFSDYAREGYFQLVAVVILAGGLLIVAEAAGGRRPAFLAAALSLVGLTFVILASAAVRLALYLQVYGWTELRFYVAASIAWLAIGGALLALLIARDRIRWLAHGLAFAAIAVTLAVTAVGPQAFVTDRNIDRALDLSLVPPGGHTGLDADYLGQLGDDAIPSLVAALPRLDRVTQAQLVPYLAMRSKAASREAPDGWAAWNLARERARAALAYGP